MSEPVNEEKGEEPEQRELTDDELDDVAGGSAMASPGLPPG